MDKNLKLVTYTGALLITLCFLLAFIVPFIKKTYSRGYIQVGNKQNIELQPTDSEQIQEIPDVNETTESSTQEPEEQEVLSQKTATITEDEMRKDLITNFLNSPSMKDAKLSIKVSNGVINLTGLAAQGKEVYLDTVTSSDQKRLQTSVFKLSNSPEMNDQLKQAFGDVLTEAFQDYIKSRINNGQIEKITILNQKIEVVYY